jgi:fructosamine-3-kinase
LNPRQREEVEALVGSRIVRAQALAGGDINECHGATLADGREIFVKANGRAPAGMFAAEARGLGWLAAAAGAALRIPGVLALGDRALVLEWIPPGRPAGDFDERLGRGLAALHRTAPGGFGLDHDNFIGPLPQANAPSATWADFYRARRLEPLLRRAGDAGLLSPRIRHAFARVLSRLEERLGPEEPPARLHGDLWSGNVLCDDGGAPCVFDPAVYGGHREIDLAMMGLFGGFSARVFDAYAEAWALSPGAAERTPVHQLYPLLVHVNLFGGAYLGNLESALAAVD